MYANPWISIHGFTNKTAHEVKNKAVCLARQRRVVPQRNSALGYDLYIASQPQSLASSAASSTATLQPS